MKKNYKDRIDEAMFNGDINTVIELSARPIKRKAESFKSKHGKKIIDSLDDLLDSFYRMKYFMKI